jgi:hypothetical protein
LRWLTALGAATAAACDLPSDLPRGWDTEFQVGATRSTLHVTQLLPNGIAQGTDRGLFTLTVPAATFNLSLGALCSACAVAHGLTVPKPAFQSTLGGAVPLPPGVGSASVMGGQLAVTLTNQLGFDPLRPSASARGSLTLTLRSASAVIGSPVTITGAAAAFPPGASLTRQLDVPGARLTDRIIAELTFDSPLGDPLTLDATQRVVVTTSASQLAVGSANVRVAGKQVTTAESLFDLRDLDGFVRDHAKSGSLLLIVTNPFEITGTLTLRINSPTSTIFKPVLLGPGTQRPEIELTREELRRIVGAELAVGAAGAAWGPDGGVPVTPRQSLTIDSTLRLVMGPTR